MSEKWASNQGISVEQFILQAVADRTNVLSQQVIQSQAEQDFEATAKVLSKQLKVYRNQIVSLSATSRIYEKILKHF